LAEVALTGAHRVLSSGGAADAQTGARTLRSLIEQAGNRLAILPGGGLHPGNIAEVARATGARELHSGLGNVIPYSSSDVAVTYWQFRSFAPVETLAPTDTSARNA